MEANNNVSLLEEYIKRKGFDLSSLDINSDKFRLYRTANNKMQEVCNFAVFPLKVEVERSETWIINCLYSCDLLVQDWNYGSGIIEKQIVINQNEHLKNFETLKQFLILQEPTIVIKPFKTRADKEEFLDTFRLNLTAGFQKIFWLDVAYKIERIWFDDTGTTFIFNNGTLSLTNGNFESWEFKLINDASISLSYCPNEVEQLTLEQSLRDCISMEKYVSSERTVAAITIGYLICWIFRKEYKAIQNEFPFLGFEWYSWCWKTSLLNFLSRVTWYNRNSINCWDTEYAFEVQMNSLWGWFYFLDELQKTTAKLQKYIQAAYNSWENHKWGKNGNWQNIQTYRKDCSLIWAWEILPAQEEALLNRFIICSPSQPFAVKKQVTDDDEFIKYRELSEKEPSNIEFLNTEEIKYLAMNYYKPRFMCILKNKNLIDFNKFHSDAVRFIEKYADSTVDTRHKNNLIAALTWYLILRQNVIDEEEISEIIKDYFAKLKVYRGKTIISWLIVQYICNNIQEFSSWLARVKWTVQQPWPMVWVKHSQKEAGLVMQVSNIVDHCKKKLESSLQTKHIKQQLIELIGINKDIKSWPIKFAKWWWNIFWTFIPLSVVKENDALKKIWDVALNYQHSHLEELQHILQGEDVELSAYKQAIQKVMPSDALEKLCEELEETNKNAQFFDESFNETEEDSKPF